MVRSIPVPAAHERDGLSLKEKTQRREKQNRRLRYIGKFLQEHELTSPMSPMSWDQLVALMPSLGTPPEIQPRLVSFADWLNARQFDPQSGRCDREAVAVRSRASSEWQSSSSDVATAL